MNTDIRLDSMNHLIVQVGKHIKMKILKRRTLVYVAKNLQFAIKNVI